MQQSFFTTISGQNQYPIHFSMPFEENRHVQQRMFTPNPQLSDYYDYDDGTNVFKDSLLKLANDCDTSLERSSVSEFELDAEIESDGNTIHETLVPEAQASKKYLFGKG